VGDRQPVALGAAAVNGVRFWRHRWGRTGPFLNHECQLRDGWWVAAFFLVLSSVLVPVLVLARQDGDVSYWQQAAIVAVATWACQRLRGKPLSEVTGRLDGRWLKEFLLGGLAGSALMLLPALILLLGGWVIWHRGSNGLSVLMPSLVLFAGVSLAEELLFRGFVFQRLRAGLGPWPAQAIVAGFFLLTHLNNPGMTGGTRVLAAANIVLASVLFGLAFIRTGSLAMPLGLHVMANWVQGGVLGFGVSGESQHGFLEPVFGRYPEWLTGGRFGLEASAPGLVWVGLAVVLLHRWEPRRRAGRTPPREAHR
jgi:membrane protease YdiL (CAAX protease family)